MLACKKIKKKKLKFASSYSAAYFVRNKIDIM